MWVEDENNQDPYGRTNPTAGTPTVGAGGGASSAPATPAGTAGTTSNPSTQTPTPTNQPTQNFGTVQDYLKGNQQQGEALGQNFTGNLATSQTNEKSAIDTAAKKTHSDITAGTTNYNAGLVNQALTDPTSIVNNTAAPKNSANLGTGGTSTGTLDDFLKQWNAAYTGPSSFENSANYAPAQAATSEATTLGTEAGTTGGQQQILHDQFGVYGQGNQGLDQAVLQNSSYFPKVQQQAKDFGTVNDYLANQATGVNAAATKGAADTAATQSQTKAAFANEPAAFQKKINDAATAAQNKAAPQAAQYAADFASGDPNKIAADLKAANPNMDTNSIQQYLTANNATNGKPTDLSKFYNYNPATAITAANTATAKDYADAAAYGKLTGVDYSGTLNPADAAKAGTAPTATSGINGTGIADYLKNQYASTELSKLGAPPVPNGGAANNPDITGPSSLVSPTGPSTDIAGAGTGAAVGSGIGNTVAGPVGGLVGGYIGATLGGNSGLSKSVNNAVGIGAGGASKDAVVYLPPMNLPPMKAPANSDPATLKLVVDTFNTPLSTSGSYHEGAVRDIMDRLDKLSGAKANGQITQDEFNSYAQPLEQWATQASQKIMSASSEASNANKSAYNRLQQYLAPANKAVVKAS